MDDEKREKIINSAFKEFSKKGLKKANITNITEEVQISRGVLFHYFGTKQVMYEKLVKYVFKLMKNEITEAIDHEEEDIFKRVKGIILTKGKLGERYPFIYDFISRMIKDDGILIIRQKLLEIFEDVQINIYHKNVDYSLFKDGLNVFQAINIIKWTMQKYDEELVYKRAKLKDNINYMELEFELNEYIDILKKALYK